MLRGIDIHTDIDIDIQTDRQTDDAIAIAALQSVAAMHYQASFQLDNVATICLGKSRTSLHFGGPLCSCVIHE